MDHSKIKSIELPAIRETTEDYDEIEEKIKMLLRREIYLPLVRELGETKKVLKNAIEDLLTAIQSGRIQFYRGVFSGKFNATISKELKAIGAKWEGKSATFKITQTALPIEVRNAVSMSASRFEQKLQSIDKKLSQFVPEEIAGKLNISQNFETALWKVEKEFKKTVKDLAIAPNLSKEQKKQIADEWQNNLKLYIKDFADKEIVKLRKDMQTTIFAGNRYESAIKTIQASYDVSVNKAKFLARQETNLLMSKFKQTRYEAAGIKEYKWRCVVGTPAHPTRERHKELSKLSDEGKLFRWDDPPNTAGRGENPRYNNPGQDYNCRCMARPVVKFKK